jgi:hypothetical protein
MLSSGPGIESSSGNFCLTWFYDDLDDCQLDGLEEKKIYDFSILYCSMLATRCGWYYNCGEGSLLS